MEQLTTTSILALFQTTKEERQLFVNDLVSKVEDGYVNPLTIQLQLKCMGEIIETVLKDRRFRDVLLTEASKMDGKSFDFHNSKMEIKEVGTKYDFTNCNDTKLLELTKKASDADDELKGRQKFLRTVPEKGLLITDEDTGETYTVYPPSKTSTTTVATTLK